VRQRLPALVEQHQREAVSLSTIHRAEPLRSAAWQVRAEVALALERLVELISMPVERLRRTVATTLG
jgi:hypothetical protein